MDHRHDTAPRSDAGARSETSHPQEADNWQDAGHRQEAGHRNDAGPLHGPEARDQRAFPARNDVRPQTPSLSVPDPVSPAAAGPEDPGVRALWSSILWLACAALLGVAAWALLPWSAFLDWAATAQRGFQDGMARALQAVRRNEPQAIWSLCAVTAAYGFAHAAGPGHGKVLLGGAALASGATLRRLWALSLAAGLAQAFVAIALVGVVALALRASSAALVEITETWLVRASALAIVAIGLVLAWRGLRGLLRLRAAARRDARGTESGSGMGGPNSVHAYHQHGDDEQGDHKHGHHHHGHEGCGHAHGPSLDEIRSLTGWRDAAALVAGIAIRPCSGALIVLLIAARFDVFAAGAVSVVAMGLGTAAFNALVTTGGVAARALALAGGDNRTLPYLSALAHLLGGVLIVVLASGFAL